MNFLTVWSYLKSSIVPFLMVTIILYQYRLIHEYKTSAGIDEAFLEMQATEILSASINSKKKDEQIAELMKNNSAILSGFSEQREEFRKLKDEIESVKKWAHVELPTAINSLLKHETAIGSPGIISTMPSRYPLRIESNKPKDE